MVEAVTLKIEGAESQKVEDLEFESSFQTEKSAELTIEQKRAFMANVVKSLGDAKKASDQFMTNIINQNKQQNTANK